jgi:hypothetical protein
MQGRASDRDAHRPDETAKNKEDTNMKSTIERRSAKGILVAAAMLAACLFTGSAQAQAPAQFRGTFTLPFAAHWGKAALPAGNYELSVSEQGEALVRIRDAKTGRLVAFESLSVIDGNASGTSELVIANRGGERVVYALRIGQLNETIVYNPKLARVAEEEARLTRSIPVTFARK